MLEVKATTLKQDRLNRPLLPELEIGFALQLCFIGIDIGANLKIQQLTLNLIVKPCGAVTSNQWVGLKLNS